MHHKTPWTTTPFGGESRTSEEGFSKWRSGYPTIYPVTNYSQVSAAEAIQKTVTAGSKPRRSPPFAILFRNETTLGRRRFAEEFIFSDEATFHLHGKVHRDNVHIKETENPHAAIQHIRDSPKRNIFCAISTKKVHFPSQSRVLGTSHLDMMEEWLMPQVEECSND